MKIFTNGIGVDVTNHHIRLVEVNHQGIPQGMHKFKLKDGYIEDDAVKDPGALNDVLKKLLKKGGLEEMEGGLNILIPDSRIFFHRIRIEPTIKEERIGRILQAAQREIPIPLKESYISIRSVQKTKEWEWIDVFAVQKEVFDGFKEAFVLEKNPITFAEANTKGIYRMFRRFAKEEFSKENLSDQVVLVDIGHRWMTMTVYNKEDSLVLSRSVRIREGKEAVSSGEKLSEEELTKVCSALKEVIEYASQNEQKVGLVLVTGVSKHFDTVIKPCAKNMKEISFYSISDVVEVPNVKPELLHVYAAAIGAAIRSARQSKYKEEHNFI